MKKRHLLVALLALALTGCEVPVKAVTDLLVRPSQTPEQFEEAPSGSVTLSWTPPADQPAGTTYAVTEHSVDHPNTSLCDKGDIVRAWTQETSASFVIETGSRTCGVRGDRKVVSYSVTAYSPSGTSSAVSPRSATCEYSAWHNGGGSWYSLTCGEFVLIDNPDLGFRIDAGARSDSSDRWERDQGFTGGVAYAKAFTDLPQTLHTSRWGFSKYTLPMPYMGTQPPPHPARVKITMVEPSWTKAGQRVFDLTVNGVVVGSNIDIFEQVGHGRPYVIEADVPNPNGIIEIVATKKVDNPIVATIEIDSAPL